jgi:hypothetical protein
MSWLQRLDQREARRLAKSLATGARETGQLAQNHVVQFAGGAKALAEPRLHDAADFLNREGAAMARAALQQAGRAARAVKADPVPAIVGTVGLAMLARLVLGRRRRRP